MAFDVFRVLAQMFDPDSDVDCRLVSELIHVTKMGSHTIKEREEQYKAFNVWLTDYLLYSSESVTNRVLSSFTKSTDEICRELLDVDDRYGMVLFSFAGSDSYYSKDASVCLGFNAKIEEFPSLKAFFKIVYANELDHCKNVEWRMELAFLHLSMIHSGLDFDLHTLILSVINEIDLDNIYGLLLYCYAVTSLHAVMSEPFSVNKWILWWLLIASGIELPELRPSWSQKLCEIIHHSGCVKWSNTLAARILSNYTKYLHQWDNYQDHSNDRFELLFTFLDISSTYPLACRWATDLLINDICPFLLGEQNIDTMKFEQTMEQFMDKRFDSLDRGFQIMTSFALDIIRVKQNTFVYGCNESTLRLIQNLNGMVHMPLHASIISLVLKNLIREGLYEYAEVLQSGLPPRASFAFSTAELINI